MRILIATLLAVLLIGLRASAQQPPKPVQADGFRGAIANGVYKNDFFGFSLNLPKNWSVADDEESAAATKVGLDVIKGKNARDNNAIGEALNREVVLVNVTRKPIGAARNAVFMMAVRKQVSSAVTPSMVAEATKSVFDTSPTLKLVRDTRKETIAGRKFALLDFEFVGSQEQANVKFFVTMTKGYALTFSLSYVDGDDLLELQKIVGSLQFLTQ